MLLKKGVYYSLKLMPTSMSTALFSPFMKSGRFPKLMAKAAAKNLNMESAYCTSGFGSIAKIVGTDMGVRNSQLALELMGQAGVRHDRGSEKRLRDAKLLQIYEGTNQLNQLNVFYCHIAPKLAGVRAFED
jgi:alkylation response protein AidB-like acyl-CoA dehydrogenase